MEKIQIACNTIATLYIQNQCLETRIFPEALKVAKVKPLYKKGDNCCFNNYFVASNYF